MGFQIYCVDLSVYQLERDSRGMWMYQHGSYSNKTSQPCGVYIDFWAILSHPSSSSGHAPSYLYIHNESAGLNPKEAYSGGWLIHPLCSLDTQNLTELHGFQLTTFDETS